jgi:hypothetical protein
LDTARHLLLDTSESEWLVIECFRLAVQTAPRDEISHWYAVLLPRLVHRHQFSAHAATHRLLWSFLEHLGQHHADPDFYRILETLLPVETDPVIFRSLTGHCLNFTERFPHWGEHLITRTHFLSEPDPAIRRLSWEAWSDFRGQWLRIPPRELPAGHLWEKIHDLTSRAITPPGERDAATLSSIIHYVLKADDCLVFQLWDNIQSRLDPRYEPDWELRQVVWQTFENHAGNATGEILRTAHHVLDEGIEQHPSILRQLHYYTPVTC